MTSERQNAVNSYIHSFKTLNPRDSVVFVFTADLVSFHQF